MIFYYVLGDMILSNFFLNMLPKHMYEFSGMRHAQYFLSKLYVTDVDYHRGTNGFKWKYCSLDVFKWPKILSTTITKIWRKYSKTELLELRTIVLTISDDTKGCKPNIDLLRLIEITAILT